MSMNSSTPANSGITDFARQISQALSLDPAIGEILASILIFVSTMAIAWAGNAIFERYFKRWASKTQTNLDDEILSNVKAPVFVIALFIGGYFSLDGLSFLAAYRSIIAEIFMILEIFTIAFTLTRVTNVLIEWYGQRRARQCATVSNHLLFILNKVTQIVIYTVAIFIILYVNNINLSSLVVGLGVGGIAIAFALQSTLSDFFSAFSIYFDRPFEIGDFIVVGDYSGTVTKIGIKSTRLQLLQGEELVVSNKELTGSSLRNFKRLQKRRVHFIISVVYDTPLEKLHKVPSIVEQIIRKMDTVEFDRVHFSEFGDFSLKFEVVYYVTTADYTKYMDTKQAVNFEILSAFEKEGIQMAFPTQTIYYMKKQESNP